jgi:hypothetical protein
MLNERIREIEAAVEDATDTLEDRSNVVRVIRELSEVLEDSGSWTAGEVELGVHEWVDQAGSEAATRHGERPRSLVKRKWQFDCARVIGAPEFARLLLAKGKEVGLLAEEDVWDDQGLSVVYTLEKPAE